MSARRLILASGSPRRVSLLRDAGYEFDVEVPDVEELHDPGLSCEALTQANAKLKALAATKAHPEAVVLAADTLVYIDAEPLTKPADLNEARVMLRRLSGRQHQVCTGVAIASGEDVTCFAVITQVWFKPLSDCMIDAYLAKVHVLDKAGSYGIQDHGEMIVHRIEGSFSNVMGLPMEALCERLGDVGRSV